MEGVKEERKEGVKGRVWRTRRVVIGRLFGYCSLFSSSTTSFVRLSCPSFTFLWTFAIVNATYFIPSMLP